MTRRIALATVLAAAFATFAAPSAFAEFRASDFNAIYGENGVIDNIVHNDEPVGAARDADEPQIAERDSDLFGNASRAYDTVEDDGGFIDDSGE